MVKISLLLINRYFAEECNYIQKHGYGSEVTTGELLAKSSHLFSMWIDMQSHVHLSHDYSFRGRTGLFALHDGGRADWAGLASSTRNAGFTGNCSTLAC